MYDSTFRNVYMCVCMYVRVIVLHHCNNMELSMTDKTVNEFTMEL